MLLVENGKRATGQVGAQDAKKALLGAAALSLLTVYGQIGHEDK